MGSKFAALALTGMIALAPFSANAAYESTTPCTSGVGTIGTTFTAVESAILAGKFTNVRDQNNMLGKLADAYTKAGQAKYVPDAVDKLQSISDSAITLAGAAKPKLDAYGADAIVAAAYTAQQCLRPM